MNDYLDAFAQFDRTEKGNKRITVKTSGSTGSPRYISHNWKKFKEAIRAHPRFRGWIWATSFDLDTYAGMQVALQAWATGGIVTHLDSNSERTTDLLRVQKFQALCCTPSFLSLLLRSQHDLSLLNLRQITLGGEPFRPALAAEILKKVPSARVTLVYASSELGVLLKTHRLDGWYEIPQLSGHQSLRLNAGIVEVRHDSTWVSTGDIGESRGSLMRIVGRVDCVANVGGNKVNLDYVRHIAEQVPGVHKASCYPIPNSVLGQVVGIDLIPSLGCHYADVKSQVDSCLRSKLPKPAWPRLWRHSSTSCVGQNSKGNESHSGYIS